MITFVDYIILPRHPLINWVNGWPHFEERPRQKGGEKSEGQGTGGEGKRKQRKQRTQTVTFWPVRSPGTRYFFLSMSAILAPTTFSTITWDRGGQRWKVNCCARSMKQKWTLWNSVRMLSSDLSWLRRSYLWRKERTYVYLFLASYSGCLVSR